jgi:hypothetical protein
MKCNWSISARTFTALCILAALAPAESSALAREVKLEDKVLLVAFDSQSGALTRLENKTAHWTIERRPELGVSFRMFAPLPDRRWNPILGQKQKAAEVKKISDHEVRLQWKNLISETGGVLPITFTAIVGLTNGVLTFNSNLQNDSPLTVETIDYPYFGDLNAPSRDASLHESVMQNGKPGNLRTDEIYPHFHNEKGYWGVFYPTSTREAQQSLFCLVQAPNEGLCTDMNVAAAPYRMQFTFEQHPGLVSSVTALVPQEDNIAGTPVHLEFRTCHFVFTPGLSGTNLAPINVSCYKGDSETGVNLFKQWHSAFD